MEREQDRRPAAALGRIAVVLVEPREPGNVGATARALANMGLGRLVLVRPAPFLVPEAFRMALAARPILERAEVHDDLGKALAAYGFVAGTTRRGGADRRGAIGPRELAAEAVRAAAAADVAVLFGREESGLTNDELKYCQRLVTIPSDGGFASLNLAQAVLVVAYELFRAAAGTPPASAPAGRAATRSLEGLFAHMEEVLLQIGYLPAGNPGRMMRVMRRIIGRAACDEREIRALRGIFRQASWYVRRHGGQAGGGR